MDETLPSEVGSTPSSPAPDPLSLEVMESVLRYWEGLEGTPWDEETRLDCIVVLQQWPGSLEEWKERLIQPPEQLTDRYRRVVQKLVDRGLISTLDQQSELERLQTDSVAHLLYYGKQFADWLRDTTIR